MALLLGRIDARKGEVDQGLRQIRAANVGVYLDQRVSGGAVARHVRVHQAQLGYRVLGKQGEGSVLGDVMERLDRSGRLGSEELVEGVFQLSVSVLDQTLEIADGLLIGTQVGSLHVLEGLVQALDRVEVVGEAGLLGPLADDVLLVLLGVGGLSQLLDSLYGSVDVLGRGGEVSLLCLPCLRGLQQRETVIPYCFLVSGAAWSRH